MAVTEKGTGQHSFQCLTLSGKAWSLREGLAVLTSLRGHSHRGTQHSSQAVTEGRRSQPGVLKHFRVTRTPTLYTEHTNCLTSPSPPERGACSSLDPFLVQTRLLFHLADLK